LVGLDGEGKTKIINKLLLPELEFETAPTIGIDIKNYDSET